MGSIKNASCSCGFQQSVVVGGSIATFRKDILSVLLRHMWTRDS